MFAVRFTPYDLRRLWNLLFRSLGVARGRMRRARAASKSAGVDVRKNSWVVSGDRNGLAHNAAQEPLCAFCTGEEHELREEAARPQDRIALLTAGAAGNTIVCSPAERIPRPSSAAAPPSGTACRPGR